MQLFCFSINQYSLAIEPSYVIAVVRAVAVTPVPGSPDVLKGMVNYHGTIVPVIDFRIKLGMKREEHGPGARFVLTRIPGREFFFVADEVTGLVSTDYHDISEPSLETCGLPASGIARMPDGIIFIYDASRFLSTEEVVRIGELEESFKAKSAGA